MAARALIDFGSEVNLISYRLAKRLQVHFYPARISLRVLGGAAQCEVRNATSLRMFFENPNAAPLEFSAYVLPESKLHAARVREASGSICPACSWLTRNFTVPQKSTYS